MSWKAYVPMAGDRKVRSKLRELEEEAGTLPIIFGVFITKIFENIIKYDLHLVIRYVGASIAVAFFYIYKHELKVKSEEVKNKAKEKVEEVKEDES